MNNADHDRGLEILSVYNMHMLRMYPDYKLSNQELINELTSRQFSKNFVEGLGFAANAGEINTTRAHDAMLKLAVNGKGYIPATNQAFYNALSGADLTLIDYISITKNAIVDSAADIVDGTAYFGDAIIATGKDLLDMRWPLMIVGGIIFLILISKELR